MKTGCVVAALLAGLVCADALEARTIRVRTQYGKYTYYGPGGRRAARAYANRYYARRRYTPRRNVTPVQRDVPQTTKFVIFPTLTQLLYFDPQVQKSPVQKSSAKPAKHRGKARRAARRAARRK